MRSGLNGRRRVRRRRGPLDAVGDAPAVIADLARELFERAFSGLRLAHVTGVVDAGRHHGDADDAFERFVERRADNDVGVLIDFLADTGCSLVDFVERRGPCRP